MIRITNAAKYTIYQGILFFKERKNLSEKVNSPASRKFLIKGITAQLKE
jgi:hypothetical protein